MNKKIILVDAWNTFVTSEGVNTQMEKLLNDYDHTKIIVTNANQEELVEFGIINMPYQVFTLGHNPNKTDVQYFLKLFKEYSLSVRDVLYFEHNEEAVKAAQSLGIKTLWLKKGSSLELLEEFLKDNL